jgi:hypothetical protein
MRIIPTSLLLSFVHKIIYWAVKSFSIDMITCGMESTDNSVHLSYKNRIFQELTLEVKNGYSAA